MSPSEFYELDMDDYTHVQVGWRNKMQLIESWHRRQAYVVGNSIISVHHGKGFDSWFNSAWPFGDEKTKEEQSKVVEKKRQGLQERVTALNNDLQLKEIVKGLRKNGRSSINTNRR